MAGSGTSNNRACLEHQEFQQPSFVLYAMHEAEPPDTLLSVILRTICFYHVHKAISYNAARQN
jgi:hypothetical protein